MTLTIICDTYFLEDILTIIHDLKEKDYYEFSEEERARLINVFGI
jgi:hypothetical protein